MILGALHRIYWRKKMSSSVLDAIKETGSKENGKPQENGNNLSTRDQDDFYEFFLVSLISIIVSVLPLICAALFSKNAEITFWDYIIGRPDILLIALSLAVTVICEIAFLNIKKTRLTKACTPALLVIIVWLMFMYGYYQFPDDGSIGYVYKKEIIAVSVLIAIGCSLISMYIAKKSKQYN